MGVRAGRRRRTCMCRQRDSISSSDSSATVCRVPLSFTQSDLYCLSLRVTEVCRLRPDGVKMDETEENQISTWVRIELIGLETPCASGH
eukprot:25497-Amorphochlora_amoeboformis.AAC.1